MKNIPIIVLTNSRKDRSLGTKLLRFLTEKSLPLCRVFVFIIPSTNGLVVDEEIRMDNHYLLAMV